MKILSIILKTKKLIKLHCTVYLHIQKKIIGVFGWSQKKKTNTYWYGEELSKVISFRKILKNDYWRNRGHYGLSFYSI